MTWIQTFEAHAFDFKAALLGEHQAIGLGDIAHALSQICRYTGHSAWHYSVAQHSVLVSQVATRMAVLAGVPAMERRAIAAWGLMHDAAEAYVGDVSRPLKHLLREHTDTYSRLEDAIDEMVIRRFDLHVDDRTRSLVKRADVAMLHWEKLALLPGAPPRQWTAGADADGDPVTIVEWTPQQARRHFLEACRDLCIE